MQKKKKGILVSLLSNTPCQDQITLFFNGGKEFVLGLFLQVDRTLADNETMMLIKQKCYGDVDWVSKTLIFTARERSGILGT